MCVSALSFLATSLKCSAYPLNNTHNNPVTSPGSYDSSYENNNDNKTKTKNIVENDGSRNENYTDNSDFNFEDGTNTWRTYLPGTYSGLHSVCVADFKRSV